MGDGEEVVEEEERYGVAFDWIAPSIQLLRFQDYLDFDLCGSFCTKNIQSYHVQFNTWTSERNIVHELPPPAGERGGGAAGCACNKVNKR